MTEPRLVKYCRKNNLRALKKLLNAKSRNIDASDIHGNTALMMAAKNNNLEIVTLLVEYGANINYTSRDGYCAIDYAFAFGSKECYAALLKYGGEADYNKCYILMMIDNPKSDPPIDSIYYTHPKVDINWMLQKLIPISKEKDRYRLYDDKYWYIKPIEKLLDLGAKASNWKYDSLRSHPLRYKIAITQDISTSDIVTIFKFKTTQPYGRFNYIDKKYLTNLELMLKKRTPSDKKEFGVQLKETLKNYPFLHSFYFGEVIDSDISKPEFEKLLRYDLVSPFAYLFWREASHQTLLSITPSKNLDSCIRIGSHKIAKFMILHNYNINLSNKTGAFLNITLKIALNSGNKELVDLLILNGVNTEGHNLDNIPSVRWTPEKHKMFNHNYRLWIRTSLLLKLKPHTGFDAFPPEILFIIWSKF